MTWAEPDEVQDHYPSGPCGCGGCGGCGADLAGAEDAGVARSVQQLEIPEDGRAAYPARPAPGAVLLRAGARGSPPTGGVPDAAVMSIGPQLRALAVYLVVFQHVRIERSAADRRCGRRAGVGRFIHSCPNKAADVVADVVGLIKTLITAAYVAGVDETTLRCGSAGNQKYVLGAFTELYPVFFPWAAHPGILPRLGDLAGLRRRGCLRPVRELLPSSWQHIAGNQACLAHYTDTVVSV